MPSYGFIEIYSNDGATKLEYFQVTAWAPTITVTSTGLTEGSAPYTNTYTYTGDKKFLGFAETANATEPVYSVGNSYTLDSISSQQTKNLYIVEGETDKDYLIKGSTLTSIADAIRAKTGGTAEILVTDMATQIGGIVTEIEEYDGSVTIA